SEWREPGRAPAGAPGGRAPAPAAGDPGRLHPGRPGDGEGQEGREHAVVPSGRGRRTTEAVVRLRRRPKPPTPNTLPRIRAIDPNMSPEEGERGRQARLAWLRDHPEDRRPEDPRE